MNKNTLNNFIFFRPEAMSVHPEFGILFFDKDEKFHKWKKLQQYLFDNYEIPDYNNGKFSFIAYGSPIYGVVDGILRLIPFSDDDRIKPELKPLFDDIWSRCNNEQDNQIKQYSISELYDIFELDKEREYKPDYKVEGNIIVYKHEHCFYK
jgi:hypothetical protein